MAEPARKTGTPLYEQDFAAWASDQARRLSAHRADKLDWDNLAEEIDSLSRRDRTEIRNRLIILLTHLLKWEHQPDRRGHSWQSTIGEQRIHIEGILDQSPSLASFPGEVFARAFGRARREAARQAGLPLSGLPETPPYTVAQTLDPDFMPGRPWSPEDLS